MSIPAAEACFIEGPRGFLSVTAPAPVVTLCERNTLTGHGLKEPEPVTAIESASRPVAVTARLDAVLSQLGR
jgi:hypothetical protein